MLGKLQKRRYSNCLYNFYSFDSRQDSVPHFSDLKWTQHGRPEGGFVSSIDGTIRELPQGKSVPVPLCVPKIPNRIMAYAMIMCLGNLCRDSKRESLKVTTLLIVKII